MLGRRRNADMEGYFMSIINPKPYTILNGQIVDAVPVNTDLDWIVSQVNANAAPLSAIPSPLSLPQYCGASGGTANAITLTPPNPIIAYAAGYRFSFQPQLTNTGAVTVAVSGLAAQPLFTAAGFQLQGGELRAGGMYEIEYGPGANFNLLGTGASVSGTYTPAWTTSGVAPVLGNGTLTGGYVRTGSVVVATINLVIGSTTTFGTNAWKFSLPFTNAGTLISLGTAQYQLAAGQPLVACVASLPSTDSGNSGVQDANGNISNSTGAWGNGGHVYITASYQGPAS